MKLVLRIILGSVLVFTLVAALFAKTPEENQISSSVIEITYLSTMSE